MNIKGLFTLDIGDSASIFNEPFTYVGHAEIELDAGQNMRWLYDDEGRMLSVAPEDEELILFRELDEDLEPEEGMLLYQGTEYEFEYEDAGTVLESEGDSVTEVDDRYLFSDYQAQGGEIIRLVKNANTGESSAFVGRYVSDDDVSEL